MDCSNFDFAIEFLKICERSKTWTSVVGDVSAVCGYTGPGVGIILLLFEKNNIHDYQSLQIFLTSSNITIKFFIDTINETIGNFFDLIDVNPVTETSRGITGLLSEARATQARAGDPEAMDEVHDEVHDEVKKVYPFDTLKYGVNIISFTHRFKPVAFHHATLYVTPDQSMCFILDSWFNNDDTSCRPLSCRGFPFEVVRQSLVRLNAEDCTKDEAAYIFGVLFLAPASFIQKISFGPFLANVFANVLNPDYVKSVYTTCETSIKEGLQTKSNLGGSIRKKNIKTKKLHKKTNIRRKKTHARRYIRTKKLRTRMRIKSKRKGF